MNAECIVCFEAFDLHERQPMSLPCGHTLCGRCALILDVYPLDRVRFDKRSLVKNFILVGFLEQETSDPADAPSQSKCTRHGKKMEMFCVDHQEELCPECLLQAHHGHEVKSFKDFILLLENLKLKISKQREYLANRSTDPWQEEREALKKLVDSEKKRVVEKIRDRTQALLNVISNYRSKILAEVDQLFAVNEKVIETFLRSDTAPDDELLDMVDQASAAIDGFGQLTIKRLSKDVITRIMNAHSLIEGIAKMQNGAFHESPAIDLASITPAISENILSAFNMDFLFNDKFVSSLYSRFDLYFNFASNSPNCDSKSVFVNDYLRSFTPKTLFNLASSCASPGKFRAIGIQNFVGVNHFELYFNSQSDARCFLFLSGLRAAKGIVEFELASKDGYELGFEWGKHWVHPISKKKKLIKNLRSVAAEFRGRIYDEIVEKYRCLSVERSNFGFQMALFLLGLLDEIAVFQ